MDWSNVVAGAIGATAVPVGVFLGEFVRRHQRAEVFASAIFTKRLAAYETLVELIECGREIADQVLTDANLSYDERHTLIGQAIMPIAEHADRSLFYINDELGAHCAALFMGVEDFPDLAEPEKGLRVANYRSQLRETRRMIFEDSGIAKANKVFGDINRPKLNSPVIDLIRELRKDQSL